MSWHLDPVVIWRIGGVTIFLLSALGAFVVAGYVRGSARKLLKEIGSSDEIAEDMDSLTKGRNIKPDGGVGRAYQALKEIRGLSNADPAAAVRHALSEYETRAGGLLALPNLCMIFGLMGTVAIFASVMPQMQDTIQQAAAGANRPAVVSSVADAFPGIGTAFFSTFWGLLWTVVAYGLARRTYWSVRQRMAEITNLMMEKVAPNWFGDPLAGLSTAAENIQDVLTKATDTLASMGTEFPKIQEGIADTTASLGEHVSKFNQAITEAGGQFKEIAGDVREVGKELAANRKALQNVQQTIEKEFENVLRNIGEVVKRLEESHSGFTDSAAKLREQLVNTATTISSKLETTSGAIAQGIAQEIRNAASEYTAKLADVNELQRMRLSDVLGSIEKATDRFNNAATHFDEAREAFTRMSGEIGKKAYDAVNKHMEKISETLEKHAENVRRLELFMRQFDPKALQPDRWSELMDRMDAVVERLPGGGGEESSRIDGQIAKLTEAVNRMESAVRSLADSLQAPQSDGLGPRLDEIRDLNQKTLAELQRMVNQQTRIITLLESSRRGVWQRVGSALGALFRRGR